MTDKLEKNKKIDIMPFLMNNGIYVVFGLLVLGIIIKDSSFLSLINFKNILTQSSVRVIVALGVAGLIVTQGTDLSAGRQVGIAALVSAVYLQASGKALSMSKLPLGNFIKNSNPKVAIIVVIILVCIVGAIFGLINGIVIAKMQVTPFIATLGTMIIFYGINSIFFDVVGASPVASFKPEYSKLVQGGLLDKVLNGRYTIPYLVIFAIIATIIMWIVWNKTTFGKNIFAVGGNPEAAKVSGVNVSKTLILVYLISGIMYAVGGFLEAARIGSATNNVGNLYELDAIAACVVGGVSFSGGIGKISGVITGVLIFTVINYGLSYIGVSPYVQYIIKGLIIITAVAMDTLKYRKRT